MGKQKVVTVKRRKKFVTFFLAETMIIRKINLFFILLWLAVATESRLAKWNDDVEPDAVDYMPVLQKVLEADAPVAQADDEDIDVEAPMKSADVRQGQENYYTLTNGDGAAFVTSVYEKCYDNCCKCFSAYQCESYTKCYYDYDATKAFKMLGIEDDAYWASKRNPTNPTTPVFVWFQFNNRQRVIKIKFKEIYPLPAGKKYEVFASNYFGNCKKKEYQHILHSGSGNSFAVGEGFENQDYFYCYGLKISDHIPTSWLGLGQLQFELEGPNHGQVPRSITSIGGSILRPRRGGSILRLRRSCPWDTMVGGCP